MIQWNTFVEQLSQRMARDGWPNYFLITPETQMIIFEQTEGTGLDYTHILGIPFECCPLQHMSRRAAELKAYGKIVWSIDLGDQHDRHGSSDGEMGAKAS